jgi:hypothetical protein
MLDIAADVVALVAAGAAVFYARKMELRARRDRERADRLYKKVDRRLADHVGSRMH